MATTSLTSVPHVYDFNNTNLTMNEHCGIFHPGKPYPQHKKLEVARIYRALKDMAKGKAVSTRKLAKQAKVSRTFAHRIMKEVRKGRLTSEAPPKKRKRIRVGSECSISHDDEQYDSSFPLEGTREKRQKIRVGSECSMSHDDKKFLLKYVYGLRTHSYCTYLCDEKKKLRIRFFEIGSPSSHRSTSSTSLHQLQL